MGGGANLVQRQGRAQRHFVLRLQPVAGRGAAAAAPRRDLRVGGLGRQLPRRQPAWRHFLRVPQELAGYAGKNGAARRRRARPQKPRHRRTRMRAGDAERGRTCQKSDDIWEAVARAPARRRRSTANAAATCPRSRCRCCPPPTGAGRVCIRAAISTASCTRRRSRSGWKCTAARTGRRFTPITASSCRSASSTIS